MDLTEKTRRTAWICALLSAATLAAYWPAGGERVLIRVHQKNQVPYLLTDGPAALEGDPASWAKQIGGLYRIEAGAITERLPIHTVLQV